MKVLSVYFIAIFSITIFATNPESENKIKNAKCAVENYELCLSHENPGVVESSLANIIKLRYRCPQTDFAPIVAKLELLSQTNENVNIRNKANMVSKILQNQDLVTKIGDNFYADLDQFLDAMLLSVKFQKDFSAIVIN